MSDVKTVVVRLTLSDNEKMALTSGVKMGGSIDQGLLAISTPVVGGELDPSRECFEKFYARMCAKATGHNTTPEYVAGLREGDNYGDRVFLNNIWEAWPDFTDYAQAALAAAQAEIVKLREYYEAVEAVRYEGILFSTPEMIDRQERAREALKGPAA